MVMGFELWDTDTGNLVGANPSQRAALDVVRGMARVEHLALAHEEAGRTREIAQGAALVARAAERRPAAE